MADTLTATEPDQVGLSLEVLAHHAWLLLLGQSSLSVIGGVIYHTTCVDTERERDRERETEATKG